MSRFNKTLNVQGFLNPYKKHKTKTLFYRVASMGIGRLSERVRFNLVFINSSTVVTVLLTVDISGPT
jgi:hypothetical protein